MSTETYGVIQVSGGKFHRPAETTHERMEWIKPMRMVCGVVVKPMNVFRDGSVLVRNGLGVHLCRNCERAA